MTSAVPTDAAAPPAKVLVVDDVEANRDLLKELLQREGHEVLLATGGEEALAAAGTGEPDLILLDVNMPGLSGLEVCRRLRSDPGTASIPVILVTALADRAQRLDGISAGANDYVTKPIDRVDLILRVRNALRMRGLHREVAAQYQRLRELERMRDELVQMLVHDLRTPLTGLSMSIQLASSRVAELRDADLGEDFEGMRRSLEELTDMVSDVLDVSRFEADAMPLQAVTLDLAKLVREVIASMGRPQREVIDADPSGLPAYCRADPALIRRVVANLAGNAIKFSPKGGRVRIGVKADATGAEVSVSDSGPGIPADQQAQIFEKFQQAAGNQASAVRSSGLGLTFCKLAVGAHGGRIGVRSVEGNGSTFTFWLPRV